MGGGGWGVHISVVGCNFIANEPELARRQRIVPREEWRMRKNSRSALKSKCKV